MHFSTYFSSAAVLAFARSAVAVPKFEKVQRAVVTLDFDQQTVVPVPGGSKLGIPVLDVTGTSDNLFNATCTGYSWTTTYDAGTEAAYTDVDVRMNCMTTDGVPFIAIEVGTGQNSGNTVRRITYEIGAPFEHLRSEFFIAEVVTPAPDLVVDVYRYIQ